MPKAAASESDLKRLQGTWRMTELEVDGASMPPGGSIAIDGGSFETIGMGGEYKGDFSVDADCKPKTFEIAYTAGVHKGKKSLGIYELTGDTWKICLGFAGYTRPSAFVTTPGCGHALETLRREKPGEAMPEPSTAHAAGGDAALDALSGEWAMVSNVRDGVPLEPQYVEAGRRLCRNGMMTVTVMGQTVLKARIHCDATKTPPAIDYEMGGPKGVKQLGIYKLEGELLTTCIAAPGSQRPAEFTSEAGSGRTLSGWKLLAR